MINQNLHNTVVKQRTSDAIYTENNTSRKQKLTCGSRKTLVEPARASLVDWRCVKRGVLKTSNCRFSLRGTPPLLWTVPGAGNTWVRNVLEQSTGLPTGSVCNDRALSTIFSGEGRCDTSVLCVKAHPTTHTFDLLVGPYTTKVPYSSILSFRNSVTKTEEEAVVRWTRFQRVCNYLNKFDLKETSPQTLLFRRALIIDRHPVHAAFSEVQRLTLNRKSHGGSHFTTLLANFRSQVNKRVWRRLCKDFLRILADYVIAWLSFVRFRNLFGSSSVHIVKYEDLLDISKRETTLKSMLDFLGAPMVVELSCAFERGNDGRIHRKAASKKEKIFPSAVPFDYI